jgi:L-threonylcarbamoyladenylate synthase
VKRLPFAAPDDLGAAVAAAAPVVAGGGVLLLPTETWYGLGADPARPDAVARVLALKGRPKELALPVLCSGWEQVEALVSVPARWRGRLTSLWPGPLTAVLEARVPLPAGAGPNLAVRIPGQPLLRSLLAALGPLTGTSANRHGAPPCAEVEAALASLSERPDAVLDGGPTPGGAASTLVDLRGSEACVLRQGPVAWS